jgi:hypothetical protein
LTGVQTVARLRAEECGNLTGVEKVNHMQAKPPGSADLLLLNGRIWTGVQPGTPAAREVEALAVRDGRVLATGYGHELEALAGPRTVVVDLEGRRAVPGLVDAHIHAIRAGLTWDEELRLGHCQRLDDVLSAIRDRAAEQPPGSWVQVLGGWHPSQLAERRLPSRAELDAVAPDHPVYLQALYDAAVLNSPALTACGLDGASAGSFPGELERDPATGAPTGVVRGMLAYPQILARMPRPSFERQMSSTASMLRSLARLGLVGVVDPGGIGIGFEQYNPLFELWRRGQLPLRTRIYYSAAEAGGELEQFEALTRFAQPCFGDDWLRVVGLGEVVHYDWHDRGLLTPPSSLSQAATGPNGRCPATCNLPSALAVTCTSSRRSSCRPSSAVIVSIRAASSRRPAARRCSSAASSLAASAPSRSRSRAFRSCWSEAVASLSASASRPLARPAA